VTETTSTASAPRRADAAPALNQPWRAWLALGEVVLATVAVLVGIWCWHRGIVPIVTPTGNGTPPLVSIVFYGNWMSGAIGLCTVAALLVLDALREIVLAVRIRRRRPVQPATRDYPLVDDPAQDAKVN
jgi:hypothetical protein